MREHYQFDNYQSIDYIFKIIQDYHQFHLSCLLKAILADRKMSIIELDWKLQEKGYYLNRESLYRYFNPSHKSHRFPSKDFVETFAEVLQLTEIETELLIQFWTRSKLLKKHNIFEENIKN